MTENQMKAHEITVSRTLSLLRGKGPGLITAVSMGRYAFWLGSGISREKLDNVPALVMTILTYLQSQVDLDNPECVFRQPFAEALELAELSEEERVQIDPKIDIAEWPVQQAIVDRISRRYSELLDIEIPGAVRDFLLWDVLDVPGTYGLDNIEPDLEHFCLAVLIMEGVAPEIVTANWDGLIEKAVDELASGSRSVLSVYVRSKDFREPRGRSRILKFHGCAVRAIKDPGEYRDLLIGRRTQITDWPHDADHSVMRQEMTTIAATRPTLMIGMSAQDENIQDLFAQAKEVLTWEWPADPPAFVFAEDVLGTDQKNILRVGYRSTYEGNEVEIANASHVRAFAKPLLSSLVLAVLSGKLFALASLIEPAREPSYSGKVRAGIDALANFVAHVLDGEMVVATRQFITDTGRAMSLLRSGKVPPNSRSYAAVGGVPIHLIADEPGARTGGLPEMALALSILGNNMLDGLLVVSSEYDSRDESRAVIATRSGGVTSRVFFAATPTAAVQLALNGLVDDTDSRTVLVHSAPLPTSRQRTPSAAPGRTGRRVARHIDMTELISNASSYDDLRQKFREGFAG